MEVIKGLCPDCYCEFSTESLLHCTGDGDGGVGDPETQISSRESDCRLQETSPVRSGSAQILAVSCLEMFAADSIDLLIPLTEIMIWSDLHQTV